MPDTAQIFSTYPSPHLSYAGGIFDQFLGTALVLVCICAITDGRNMKVPKQCVPLYVGVTVLGVGISFGFNSGYAVNPARDLAPRVFTGCVCASLSSYFTLVLLSPGRMGSCSVQCLQPLVGGACDSLPCWGSGWYLAILPSCGETLATRGEI